GVLFRSRHLRRRGRRADHASNGGCRCSLARAAHAHCVVEFCRRADLGHGMARAARCGDQRARTGRDFFRGHSVDGASPHHLRTRLGRAAPGRGLAGRGLGAVALLAGALGGLSAKHVDLPRWAIAALLASAFAAALVHSGHAAATAGWLGTFHRAADGLHLIAASAWLGGLLPLALLLAAARPAEISLALARDATLRFSTLGLISVGLLIATGIVNGWILAGSVPALIGTDYGRLLLAKVALFLAMVAVAAVNRLRLTPRLALAISSPPC